MKSRKTIQTTILAEICSSHPEFWKGAIINNFEKFLKNCNCSNDVDTQPAILIQKSFQQRWF